MYGPLRTWCVATLLLTPVIILMATVPAFAQSDQSSEADRLIQVGVELRQRGQDQQALRIFEQAQELNPSARARGQIALAQHALGMWLEAEQNLRTVLISRDAWVERNRTALNDAYQDVTSHIALLEVEGPTGAQVSVNGQVVAMLPMSEPARVLAGSAVIEVRAEGFVTDFRDTQLSAREVTRLTAQMRREESQAEPGNERSGSEPGPAIVGSRAQRDTTLAVAGWALIGVGGAGLIAGGVFTLVSYQSADDLNTNPACGADPDPQPECPGTFSLFETTNALQFVGYGVGGAALAVGIVMLIADGGQPEERSASLRIDPILSPIGAGAQVRFSF